MLFYLYHVNPFSKAYRWHSLLLIIVYLLYLFIYFGTKISIDKQIEIGIGTAINMWYFVVYLIFPLSKRIADLFPSGLFIVLKIIKIALTVAFPIFLVYAYKNSKTSIRFFVIWPIFFLAPAAVFSWHIGLLDLYSERTISRFMYVAVPGLAVIFGYTYYYIYNRHLKALNKNNIKIPLLIIFLACNWLLMYKISGLYRHNQQVFSDIIEVLSEIKPLINECDTLTIVTDNMNNTVEYMQSGMHTEAVIFVVFEKQLHVEVTESKENMYDILSYSNKHLILGWDSFENKLVVPPKS